MDTLVVNLVPKILIAFREIIGAHLIKLNFASVQWQKDELIIIFEQYNVDFVSIFQGLQGNQSSQIKGKQG